MTKTKLFHSAKLQLKIAHRKVQTKKVLSLRNIHLVTVKGSFAALHKRIVHILAGYLNMTRRRAEQSSFKNFSNALPHYALPVVNENY
jgi:hypothetical protein